MGPRIICSEQDLWDNLADCLSARSDSLTDGRIVFDGWPALEVTIDPGDGTVTPEAMRAHLALQRAVNCCFAYLKYGSPNTSRLTRQDRHAVKLYLQVERGSTRLKIDLSRALETMGKAAIARMGPTLTMCAVLGLAGVIGTTAGFGMWAYFHVEAEKERTRGAMQLELVDKLLAAEIRRLEINQQTQRELVAEVREVTTRSAPKAQLLKEAAERSPVVLYAVADYITAARTANASRKAAEREGRPVVQANNWMATVTRARNLEPPMRLGGMST